MRYQSSMKLYSHLLFYLNYLILQFILFPAITSSEFLESFSHVCLLMLCFICSQYDHLWHQVCSSLGLCRQSRQFLKVHCILCALLLKQQMAELLKSYLKRGMIFARTSWYSFKTFLFNPWCMLANGYLCMYMCACHVLSLRHIHKLYLMYLEKDFQKT